jgi:hypothetical protein
MNSIRGIATTCWIADKNPILGTLIAYGIEYTIDSFVLIHVGAVDVT